MTCARCAWSSGKRSAFGIPGRCRIQLIRDQPPRFSPYGRPSRAEYHPIGDEDVLDALQLLSELEGIIHALVTAHAVAWITREAGKSLANGSTVLLNLSGRGDKDVAQVRAMLRGES